MLREIAGVDAVSGLAEVDGYFTLRGQTAREMMQSLSGRVALAASEGAVEGVDVPAISRQIDALSKVDTLDDIASFVDGTEQSLSSGRTAIRSLDGTVRVQDGQARIDGFEIVAEGGVGEISGTADVPAWQLDLTALFRLTEHADAPPVGIRFEGPIDRPERRYLIADMQAHLVKLGAALARRRARHAQDHAAQGRQGGARNRDGHPAQKRSRRSGQGRGHRDSGRAERAGRTRGSGRTE